MSCRMEISSTLGSPPDLSPGYELPRQRRAPKGKRRPILAITILLAVWGLFIYLLLSDLPDVRPLKSPRHNMRIMVRNARGKQVPFIVGPRNPFWTPLTDIPAALQWGVIVAEDDTFYEHHGFNFAAMRDAILEDIKERRFVRGGSTITQQLAKNLYLSGKKSLWRKFKEALITLRLERHLSKRRILELYLNVIEFAPGIRGVGAASRHYFGKPPQQIDFFESILLAAVIPSPRLYNPLLYPERALRRYKTVVRLLYRSRLITAEQYEIATAVRFMPDPVMGIITISPE